MKDLSDALQQRAHARRPSEAGALTPRELDIVAAIVDGAGNKDIAQQFGVSQQTVKNHLSSIFDKLGVSTRLELALYAINHNVLASQTSHTLETRVVFVFGFVFAPAVSAIEHEYEYDRFAC